MEPFFRGIDKIRFEGPDSENPLAFRFYDPDRMILGKRLSDHLRCAVCYWHTFCGQGTDPFGGQDGSRPGLQECSAVHLRILSSMPAAFRSVTDTRPPRSRRAAQGSHTNGRAGRKPRTLPELQWVPLDVGDGSRPARTRP